MLKNCQKDKLIFIKNKINKGPSISIKILKICNSKYFYITTTDDIILDGFLIQFKLLDKYKNAAFVFSDPFVNNLNLNKKMKINCIFGKILNRMKLKKF